MTASKPRTQSHDVTAWRASAQRLLDRANEMLLDDVDTNGVATRWLASRGLHTVRAVCGYIPIPCNATWGGLDVHIPSGFLLAWYDHPDQHPYKLNVRRLDPKPNETKYHMIRGSENGLYNAHLIPNKPVVVLVEGELDALSIMHATNAQIYAVATGSVTGGRLQRYIAMLATRRTVLIAFDNDEPGEQASRYWLDLLPNGKRLTPLAHDPNDMLCQKMDITKWIRSAL
jgi:5S rRNA maturation endonuclease (ribonuclease M5)